MNTDSTAIERTQALSQALNSNAASVAENEKYLTGKQPLAFMSSAARAATNMTRIASNIPAVQVNSLAERLRVTDLSVEGDGDALIWADYRREDLDQRLPLAFREALGLGSSFAIVWDPSGSGRPRVSIESPHEVIVQRDPVTREIVAALKRVSDGGVTRAWLYEPDRITALTADGDGASLGWREGGSVRNPLGVVPVVEFRNSHRLGGPGVCEAEDIKGLTDALNKVVADMMVGSEFYARPRRWATGVEMETDEDGNAVNPFPEGDRMMISEGSETRFGSLAAADLGSYEAAVKIILAQIMANSSLPGHYLGQLTGQTPGADGLRAAEAALSARAASKQGLFGRSVEQVGGLMWAIRTGADPQEVAATVRWADPATRSVAQEADAVVKLHADGLLPTDYALARLGYDAGEIRTIRAARTREAVESVRIEPTR